jgi:predicted regulator of Ras-like GTPase activity (Roadblock/LC7/MglB family)
MTAAVTAPGAPDMLVDPVLAEIRTLRKRLPDVTGVLLATIDGLLVAHDTEGLEVDALAAMSAAQLGLGQQLAAMAAQGDLSEAVARCSGGSLAIFAAGPGAVLTVLAGADLNVGRLHHEARPVAARLAVLLATNDPAPRPAVDEPAAWVVGDALVSRRTTRTTGR